MNATPASPRRIGRYLGISAIIAGACFLFDPFVSVIDLLPDAVGYLLIALGLYRLSDMDDRIAEASRAAGRLALLSLGRIVAFLLTFGLVSNTERPVFTLLVLFCLGVLDVILLIPLWKNLLAGFLYLGSRHDATALFDRNRGRGLHPHEHTLVERYTAFSTVFFILREAAVILPELTVLTHERGGAEVGTRSLYNYVGVFRLTGIAISAVIGIIWLVRTVSFVRRLKRDKPFMDALRSKYETEVLPRRELFAARATKAGLVCLSAAFLLSVDVYLDGVNIIPDALAAICLILALLFLRRFTGKQPMALAAAIIYTLLSAFMTALQLTVYNPSMADDIHRLDSVHTRWLFASALQAATSALFIFTVLLILRAIWDLVRRHTGIRALHAASTAAAERTESIHRLIRRKLCVVGVLTALVGVSTVVHWWIIPALPALDIIGRPTGGESLLIMAYNFLREGYWSADLTLGLLLFGYSIHAAVEVFEQMDYSYLMNATPDGSR